jgi:AcrR family transcriptional regulator
VVDAAELPVADPRQRAGGTRSRAGNAMGRTRAAVLSGAVLAIEKHGLRRMTMADVAAAAGVAKATLYNHFRAKPDVVVAVVEAESRALADACAVVAARDGLAAALAYAAETVSAHAALRRVVAEEPAEALALLTLSGRGRAVADELTARVCAHAGVDLDEAGRDVIRRWVLSHVADPVDSGDSDTGGVREAAEVLAAAVTSSPAPSAAPYVGGA